MDYYKAVMTPKPCPDLMGFSRTIDVIDVITNPDLFGILVKYMPGKTLFELEIYRNWTIESAIEKNNVDVLEVFNKNDFDSSEWEYAIWKVVKHNKIEILKWLIINRKESDIIFDAMNAALYYSNLNLVKYIHSNNINPCEFYHSIKYLFESGRGRIENMQEIWRWLTDNCKNVCVQSNKPRSYCGRWFESYNV